MVMFHELPAPQVHGLGGKKQKRERGRKEGKEEGRKEESHLNG